MDQRRSTPNKYPWSFKMMVVQLNKIKGYTAREAIIKAKENYPRLTLPKSYYSNPHTHIHRFVKEIEKEAQKKEPYFLALCKKYDITITDSI